MKRTFIITGLASLTLIATSTSYGYYEEEEEEYNPTYGYYQDQYNPNSETYQGNKSRSWDNDAYRDSGTYVAKKSQAKYQKQAKKRKASSGGGSRSYAHPQSRPATGRTVFIYDPRKLTWAAYDANGNLVRTGAGSSGRGYCPDIGRGCRTPSGTYSINRKYGSNYRSSRYPLPRGGAPMPYAMFFSKYYAVHGSYDVPAYNASHGCIRVNPSDAAWLNHNFLHYGSTVIVKPY